MNLSISFVSQRTQVHCCSLQANMRKYTLGEKWWRQRQIELKSERKDEEEKLQELVAKQEKEKQKKKKMAIRFPSLKYSLPKNACNCITTHNNL